jgi:ribonucleotide reductase beta subunit family protein with ferritin-like domain
MKEFFFLYIWPRAHEMSGTALTLHYIYRNQNLNFGHFTYLFLLKKKKCNQILCFYFLQLTSINQPYKQGIYSLS